MIQLLEKRDSLLELQKSKSKKYVWTFERLSNKYELKNHQYNALRFLCMNHVVQLSLLIEYDLSTLEKLINEPRYQVFKIVKKKGGYRNISAPNPILKKTQSKLNFYLQACYLSMKPECVHGFVINPKDVSEKFNIVNNASKHIGKKEVLNIDIEDFFNNISARQVYQLFLSAPFNFPEHLSKCIALLCTYQAKLPTGAPTSPVLSNLICITMDNELQALANTYGYVYTRYADDLSFSTDTSIDQKFEEEVYAILEKSGFNSQTKKRRLQKYYQHQNVTGIVVNEKANIKREKIKKIRAMLHDAKVNGLISASLKHYGAINHPNENILAWHFIQKLRAEISFLKFVRGDDELYKRYEQEFHSIMLT